MKNPLQTKIILIIIATALFVLAGYVFSLLYDVRLNDEIELKQEMLIQERPVDALSPTDIQVTVPEDGLIEVKGE